MGLVVPHARLYVEPDWWDFKSLIQGFDPLEQDLDQTLRQDFNLILLG